MTNPIENSQTSTEEDEVIDSVNPTRWPIAWLLIIVLAIVFVIMRMNGTFEPTPPATAAPEQEFPHFYLTEVNVKQFDDKGDLHYQMTSPIVRHFGQLNDSQGKSLFSTPIFTFQNHPDAPLWTVTANLGQREQNGLWFKLIGDVKAQKPTDERGDFELNTQELHMNTREEFAQTDKAVTMRSLQGSKKSETQALGARADFKKDVVDLVSEVKGYHEP